MKECEDVLEDCMLPNVEEERSNVFVVKINMQITNEDMIILENMNKTEVGNITELHDLVYAEAVVVMEMLGVKDRKSTGMEPWWKRRMEAQVKQLNLKQLKTFGILIP